ncbi:MAG: DNA-3-methyladenine glycosylase [Clostridia bacterium]|nr:DNA-3-methyladenine glycosylase [Clostridia bacterium]
MILNKGYFEQPATFLAPDLIGKILCRKTANGIIRSRITETECYFGEEDTACHAHKGKTQRTSTMYESGGITYVYLCYGMHAMLNIVTGPKNHPEAVLIRGVEAANGPGRTTKFMYITTAENALSLCEENGIWIEDDGARPEYTALPRVGIDYASKDDRERPWRYIAKKRE